MIGLAKASKLKASWGAWGWKKRPSSACPDSGGDFSPLYKLLR